MFVEKEANSTSGELAFGFRFAARYGVDGPDTQGFGHPGPTRDLEPDYTRGGKYDWALPLLYGELAMGELARGELARGELARGDLRVSIGHFYGLMGYVSVPARKTLSTLIQ
ncbi:hypothetical protein OAF34_05720 [Pirellulaceae bacterium]|nr:hypothetical protein [Pirellulaceae bacterium]